MKKCIYVLYGLVVFSTYSMETESPPSKKQKIYPTAQEDIDHAVLNAIARNYGDIQGAFEDLQHSINTLEGRHFYQLLGHRIYDSSENDDEDSIGIMMIKDFLTMPGLELKKFTYPQTNKQGKKKYLDTTPLMEAIVGLNWHLATLILQYLHAEDLLIPDTTSFINNEHPIALDLFAHTLEQFTRLMQSLQNQTAALQQLHNSLPRFKDFITSMLTFGSLLNEQYSKLVDKNPTIKKKIRYTNKLLEQLMKSSITLHVTTRNANLEQKILAINNKVPEMVEEHSSITPLMKAIKTEDWPLADLILEHLKDEDLLTTDNEGNTALDYLYRNLEQRIITMRTQTGLTTLKPPHLIPFFDFSSLLNERYSKLIHKKPLLKNKIKNNIMLIELLINTAKECGIAVDRTLRARIKTINKQVLED